MDKTANIIIIQKKKLVISISFSNRAETIFVFCLESSSLSFYCLWMWSGLCVIKMLIQWNGNLKRNLNQLDTKTI